MKRIAFLFLIASVCGASSQAYPADSMLTWEDVVSVAKANNPDLASSYEQIEAARADRLSSSSGFWPGLSLGMDASTSKSGNTSRMESYSFGLTGSQLLFDGLQTPYRFKSAGKMINWAKFGYDLKSSGVRYNLRIAFTDLLKAQELTGLTKGIKERREQNLELVRLRYKSGREHRGSLLTSEANLAEAEYEYNAALRDVKLKQRSLLTEMGVRDSRDLAVAGNIDDAGTVSAKPDFGLIAEETPSLRQAKAIRESYSYDLKAAKGNFLPSLYATGSVGRGSSDWPPEESQWSAGITLELPLFTGFSATAEVHKARATYLKAVADENNSINNVLRDLESAWIAYTNALDRVSVEGKFLKAAEERARIAQAQYSTGLVTFNDWTIIEDNLVGARKSALEAKRVALATQANWLKTRGVGLDEK